MSKKTPTLCGHPGTPGRYCAPCADLLATMRDWPRNKMGGVVPRKKKGHSHA